MADIFVSYTSSDREWAFWIGQQLEKLGHVEHIHEWEIEAGGNIPAWMQERQDKADHTLCVISNAYLSRPYSSWELQAAQWAAASDRPNFMLPVFVEDCKAPTMLAPFKRERWSMLRLIVIGALAIGALGIIAWLLSSLPTGPSVKANNCGLANSGTATGNTVNCGPAPSPKP